MAEEFKPTSTPDKVQYHTHDGVNSPLLSSSSSSSGGSVVRAIRFGSNQAISDTTTTEIQWNQESVDTGGDFNTSTYTYTLPRTGYYQVHVNAILNCVAIGDRCTLYIKVNGSTVAGKTMYANFAGNNTFNIQDIVISTAGAEITVDLYHDCGSTRDLIAGPAFTYMTINEL